VLAIRLDGTIVSCNAAAERLYDRAAAALVGQSIAALFPREASTKMPQMLEQVSRGETIAPFESVRQRVNGRPFQLLVTISPIKNAAGSVRGACTLVRDISRRKLAEKRIKLYQQQLRGLVAALSFAEQRERRRIAAEFARPSGADADPLQDEDPHVANHSLLRGDQHAPEEVRLLLDESIATRAP
jgi:PAS domain S-box-containing protein